ncbi:unnamed protein product [Urochloa decumbens]|uniref:Bifunctional inhibitor/plant lipid transfer protein/seed storage helical domain-containing protein n=1 Tax=Urochloa decumbens TaxID=240449 RepID=A0ABC8YZI5_9POAL
MAAGRKQLASTNAAVAVALVAMLLVASSAAAQDCGVSDGTMKACLSYCSSGGSKDACCGPMKKADVGCLCSNYWNKYKSVTYIANCATKISSQCGINHTC